MRGTLANLEKSHVIYAGLLLLGVAGTACSDGQFCTTPDTCTGGACGGAARDCSDPNPCTADSCNETTDFRLSISRTTTRRATTVK